MRTKTTAALLALLVAATLAGTAKSGSIVVWGFDNHVSNVPAGTNYSAVSGSVFAGLR